MKLLKLFAALVFFASLATATFAQTTYSNIDQMSAWNTCARCGGAGGTGPATLHSLTQGISSPSMDGKSAHFWAGGTDPWANAYWWYQFAGTSHTHFTYDAYFYLKNPNGPHALEFDASTFVNGKQYIFGTECVHNSVWKIFDTYNRTWRPTSLPCPTVKAYSWNHLTLEFQRVNGQAKFISVTLNGAKHYWNQAYNPHSGVTAYKTTFAFQMDEDKYGTDIDAWLDKVKFTHW